MKYKFSIIANIFLWAIPFTIVFIYTYYFLHDQKLALKCFIGGCALLIGMIIRFNSEYLNRYVQFNENYFSLNSYRIAQKVRSFNIPYESVRKLEAVCIPLIGIYKVTIYADNIPWGIPVTCCMVKHNKMFTEMYSTILEHHPEIDVSENYTRFIERHKNG